jgi:hypothetical protein
MSYPPSPWQLHGHALQTLHLIDRSHLQSHLAPGLELVEPWPGKAIATVYLSSYESGSVLEYSELIIGTLVRHRQQVGGWVTHIYVDNPDSVAGGREIWGLPKELAEFNWETGDSNQVSVRQGDRLLCAVRYHPSWSLWRFPISATSFCMKDSTLFSFGGQISGRWNWLNAQVEVPNTSPFAGLNLGQPWLAIAQQDMQLRVDTPQKVASYQVT